jgi:hypothetical protein
VEVNRPDRATRYRVGKSDAIDAEMAARAVLAGVAAGVPKTGAGNVEMIRVLKMAKDSAIKACTQSINEIKGLLVTAPAPLRESLSSLTIGKLLNRCATLRPGELDSPTAATKHALRLLARRILNLRGEARTLETQINELITATAPQLLDLFGVVPNSAAALLTPPATTPNGSIPKQPAPPSAESAQSRHHPANQPTPTQPRRRPPRQRRTPPHHRGPPAMAPPTRDYRDRRLTEGKMVGSIP